MFPRSNRPAARNVTMESRASTNNVAVQAAIATLMPIVHACSRTAGTVRLSAVVPVTTASVLIGQPWLHYELGGVWGTGRFPTFSKRRGHAGETGFPPRPRAE